MGWYGFTIIFYIFNLKLKSTFNFNISLDLDGIFHLELVFSWSSSWRNIKENISKRFNKPKSNNPNIIRPNLALNNNNPTPHESNSFFNRLRNLFFRRNNKIDLYLKDLPKDVDELNPYTNWPYPTVKLIIPHSDDELQLLIEWGNNPSHPRIKRFWYRGYKFIMVEIYPDCLWGPVEDYKDIVLSNRELDKIGKKEGLITLFNLKIYL